MGDLLLVSRVRGRFYGERCHKRRYYTASFSVVHDGGIRAAAYEYCWVPMNSSISLSGSEYLNGCFETSCIYFTDDQVERSPGGGYDMEVFNMKDGTIKRHFHTRTYTLPSRVQMQVNNLASKYLRN